MQSLVCRSVYLSVCLSVCVCLSHSVYLIHTQAPKVKLYYRNDKDVDPPPDQPDRLNIERDGKKCPGKCPMSTFFQITDKMVPKDFKKECGVNEFIKQLDVAGCSSAFDMSLLFPLLAFTSLNNCVIVLMQS